MKVTRDCLVALVRHETLLDGSTVAPPREVEVACQMEGEKLDAVDRYATTAIKARTRNRRTTPGHMLLMVFVRPLLTLCCCVAVSRASSKHKGPLSDWLQLPNGGPMTSLIAAHFDRSSRRDRKCSERMK